MVIFQNEIDSKELYFKLNSSFQINSYNSASHTFKYAGIYAIFKDNICYYVGQSQNLASRLSQHLSGKYCNCDTVNIYLAIENGFSDFYERDKESRKLILDRNEMMLIKLLKPVENLITCASDFDLDECELFQNFLEFDNENYHSISSSIEIRNDKNVISVTSGDGFFILNESSYLDERIKENEVIFNALSKGVDHA